MSDKKKIAKNTLYLYLRSAVTMLVSLYTSRVILSVLGAVDFGIYNVVGGIVMMASFVNAALSVASSRFLTFELGRGNIDNLKKTFSASLTLHIIVALLVLVFAETVGLWLFYTKLVIPEERMDAAFWVFQFSVVLMMITFTQVPYNSCLIAHENLSVYAYVGLYDSISKLGIVYLLMISPIDKLVFYSLLLLINTALVQLFLRYYTINKYEECHLSIIKDKQIYKNLFSYSGWNLVGGLSYVVQGQGISILLNMFFGPVVNAARAITTQIQNASLQFINNFLTAVRPQVVKNFAKEDYDGMYNLTFQAGKISMYLLLAILLPICFELKYILALWLGGNAPDQTYIYGEIVLITCYLDQYCQIINMPYGAIGKMMAGNLGGGIIQMLALPLGYLCLIFDLPSYFVFYAILITIIFKTIYIWILTHSFIKFEWSVVAKTLFFPTIIVTILSMIVPLFIIKIMDESFLRFVTLSILSELSLFYIIFKIGLTIREKQSVTDVIKNKFLFIWNSKKL